MSSGSSAGSSSGDNIDFGQTYVINPTGLHRATIVWLHDIGRTGFDLEQAVKNLNVPNIKWICPTAPLRDVTHAPAVRITAWFNMRTKVFEGMQDDLVSLEYVNSYITRLLYSEAPHVIKGVGGIGMGAAQALYYASAYAFNRVPIKLNIVIGINGWLPNLSNLFNNMNAYSGASTRAKILKLLIIHRTSDENIVTTFPQSSFVKKCVDSLISADFPTWFKRCRGGTEAMNEVRTWLAEYGTRY